MRTAHDRLSGKQEEVRARPLLGRYADDRDGTPVAGDEDGRPEPMIVAAVVDIVDRNRQATGQELLNINMFVPDASIRANPTELDLAIAEYLPSLSDVCLRPHDRLDHLTELTRVELARRVPPAGLTRLASHSEDIAGIERGILHPARLLSTRYTDDIDFYENQVAAQLVDRLDRYLGGRIAGLRVLERGLANLDEYNEALSRRQSWRKLGRTAGLVAAVMADHQASTAAIRASITELSRLRTRLRLLWGSPALRRANRSARLPLRLMRTNLFVQERRYRKVGMLWEAWALHESDVVTEEQRARTRFRASYRTYVAILTVRALNVLGYEVERADGFPAPNSTAFMRRGEEALTCAVDTTGVLTISVGGNAVSRVVPIEHDLGAPASHRIREQWLGQLDGCGSVVVYPGSRDRRAALPAPTRSRLHHAIDGVVPVSPVEMDSEERLARALRWPLQGRRYLSGYPIIASATPPRSGNWFQRVRGGIEITRRPSEADVTEFVAEESVRRRVRGWTASARKVLDEVDRGMTFLETCPLCGTPSGDFIGRDGSTFRCWCSSCSTAWGLNRCGVCGHRYPFLWPRNTVVDARDADRIDATAGADLLAEPCVSPDIEPGSRFRCSECGHCGGAPNCGCLAPPD